MRKYLGAPEDLGIEESVKLNGKWGFLEVLMWFGRKEDV